MTATRTGTATPASAARGARGEARAGEIGWTEDAQPVAAGASAALVRSLLGESVVPRLAVGAVQLLTSDSLAAEPQLAGEWVERLPSRYVLPRHAHETHELCWVIEGRCVLWLG